MPYLITTLPKHALKKPLACLALRGGRNERRKHSSKSQEPETPVAHNSCCISAVRGSGSRIHAVSADRRESKSRRVTSSVPAGSRDAWLDHEEDCVFRRSEARDYIPGYAQD